MKVFVMGIRIVGGMLGQLNLQINKNQYKDKLVSDIFRDSFIIMLIMVVVGSIASGIDSAVAGNFLTVEAVSAIGIIYPFTKLLECISKIFSSGVQIVCSGQLGEGRMKEVNRTFSSVAIVVLAVSIIITIIVIALKTPLSMLFGARVEAGTLILTEKYLFAVALGTPGCLATMFLIPMLQMDGDKKRVNAASIVMMVVNAAFSTVAVVCFGMGIEGIGYGTALSYYASSAVLLSHFASKNCRLKFYFGEADFKHTWKVISVGSVAAAKLFVSAINNIVINNLVAAFCDANAMAAFAIFKATKHLFVAFDDAAADTVRLLTGMLQAEKDRRGLRQLFKSAFGISFTGSAIISILLFIFAEPFFSLFIGGEALSITVTLMRIFVISIIVDVAAFFYLSYFQCLNKKTYVLILILCMNGISMLAAWAFGVWWGITGIWWSIAFSDTLCAVAAFVLVFINNKRIRFSIDDLMMISENFGGREENKLDMSIGIGKIQVLQESNGKPNAMSFPEHKYGCNIIKNCGRSRLFPDDKSRELSVRCRFDGTINNPGNSNSAFNKKTHKQGSYNNSALLKNTLVGSIKKTREWKPVFNREVDKCYNYNCGFYLKNHLIDTLDILGKIMSDVSLFCKVHKYDRQKVNHCMLAIEETISNILKYGFDSKNNGIDLRITAEGETLIISVRDNCRAFNPIENFRDDNYIHNGLRIINTLSTDIEYVNAFGLNCLTIHI